MSKKTYMMFDITVFTIIACIIEGVITYMSNMPLFLAEGFTVSLVVLFSIICIFRWNWYGVIPGIFSTIVAIAVQNTTNSDLVAGYSNGMIVGSLFAILAVNLINLFFKWKSKKVIKESLPLLVMYVVIAYAIYIVAYSIVWGLIDQYNIIDTFKKVAGRNLINMVMSAIVIFIANKQRYFLVDMNDYLIYMNTVPDSIRIRKEIHEDKSQSLLSEVVSSDEINDIALLDGGMMSEEELILLNKTFKDKEGDKNHGTTKKS